MIEPSQKDMIKAIEALIAAQTWEEKKDLVEAQRDMLLTEAADQVFASLIEQYRGDANTTQFLEDYRDLLMRCQHDGIAIAFADRLHSEELQSLLSGRAALKHGDEHVGLIQAMLTTGVQAVVSSLWPVNDAATKAFFETFYPELTAGRSPARAIQQAAQSVQEHPGWAHPSYRAAFQVSCLAHGTSQPEQLLPSSTNLTQRIQ